MDVESLGLSNDDPEDPTDLVKFFKMPLIKIRKEIVALAAVHPTTDEIRQRVELLYKTTENLQVLSMLLCKCRHRPIRGHPHLYCRLQCRKHVACRHPLVHIILARPLLEEMHMRMCHRRLLLIT
ncbi:uncharacterized protein LOC131050287 [Cryptomeria japonica]|uniref:uncharacterized protein LOC131050287 n=1 Tax=Cryptomeria japonica TaxID=3369 RepID=UPI0027DA5222|nr:uncharacterized protein LOC131050287 [Cryptomeria japonica]